jgi:hypothetical protein
MPVCLYFCKFCQCISLVFSILFCIFNHRIFCKTDDDHDWILHWHAQAARRITGMMRAGPGDSDRETWIPYRDETVVSPLSLLCGTHSEFIYRRIGTFDRPAFRSGDPVAHSSCLASLRPGDNPGRPGPREPQCDEPPTNLKPTVRAGGLGVGGRGRLGPPGRPQVPGRGPEHPAGAVRPAQRGRVRVEQHVRRAAQGRRLPVVSHLV